MEKIGGSMSESTLYIDPLVGGSFNVFMYKLRELHSKPGNVFHLTEDQLVFAASALHHLVRRDFSIGGMKIASPRDIAMPDVLEHLFHHRDEAEIAGAYLLAFTGCITTPEQSKAYQNHHINFYEHIGRSCIRIAAAAPALRKGHRGMLAEVGNEYHDIREQITGLSRYMAQNTYRPRPS